MAKFSKRAKRHAAESKMRSRRMVKDAARRSGPVTISYLPGFEPPEPTPTKYPFVAWINGEKAWVSRDIYGATRIEYET